MRARVTPPTIVGDLPPGGGLRHQKKYRKSDHLVFPGDFAVQFAGKEHL
jgi:hypothetical protein